MESESTSESLILKISRIPNIYRASRTGVLVVFFGFYPTKIRSDAVTWESHLAANQTVAAISDNARSRASQAMDRERRPPFRDDSVRGMHAYDPQASPTETVSYTHLTLPTILLV